MNCKNCGDKLLPHYIEEFVLLMICPGCGRQETSKVGLVLAASNGGEC